MAKGSNHSNNNRANQMNPNNSAYHSSREGGGSSKAGRDNRSNQMNPNNKAYSSSRWNSGGRNPGIFSGGAAEGHNVSRREEGQNNSSVPKAKKTMRVIGTGVAVGLAGLLLKNMGKK